MIKDNGKNNITVNKHTSENSVNKNFVMDNVTEKLVQCFGHRKFKSELQERAVRAIARGKLITKYM